MHVTRALHLERPKRLARELTLVRKAFRNWLPVVAAGALWRHLPLPRRDIVLESRNGARFVAPLDSRAGALYPALDVFAFSAYDHDWVLEESPFVIDIGAHIGAFVLWLAERYPGIRGECYEPDPAAFSYLVRNVATLGVAACAKAVADRSGTAPLFRRSAGGGTSSLRGEANHSANTVEVPIISFDELMAKIDSTVALVKLDCEGSEWDIVLKSDPSSWRLVRRVVIEYHDVEGLQPRALVERLKSLGFSLVRESFRFAEGTYWFARTDG